MDKEKIEYHIRGLLEAIGENPDRPGLVETPKRVANMCAEVFEGIALSNQDIAERFGKTFDMEYSNQPYIVMKDISVFSYCEHHMALMYDMTVNVAYIPNGKVLGLSKIARICDMAAKRLQLQEKLGSDIAEIISIAADTESVGVKIIGSHSCMTARGIRNVNARTETRTLLGQFQENERLASLLD
ncbi:MAG: GTP cyclohydrolase I [Clostridia bacterium]|nr:GTP cyclohydrolase I [Clostridia bacterium]